MLTICLLLSSVVLPVLCALPANQHLGNALNRTRRGEGCSEDEYWHKGNCCKNCPAGSHVAAHCTVNHGPAACKACTPGEDYTVGPNGLEKCISCDTCTNDKVLVHACTRETNTVCECKSGYYCRPGGPCEICSRCSRCGEGQRISKECTPTTDRICEAVSTPGPISTKANVTDKRKEPMPNESFSDVTRHKTVPTDPPDGQAGSLICLYVILPIVSAVLIVGIGVYIWYRRRTNRNKSSLIGITQNSENTSLDSIRTEEEKDPREEELPPEHQPLVSANPGGFEQQIHVMSSPVVVGAQREPMAKHVAESAEGDVEYEEDPQVGALCEECKRPQPCDDQWVEFFYTVIDNVQPDRMLQLVRKLHLHRTLIDQIVKDHSNDCKERSYKLLDQWRYQKGKQASMKAVFQVLHCMDLGGCCENIINDLKTKKIPMN